MARRSPERSTGDPNASYSSIPRKWFYLSGKSLSRANSSLVAERDRNSRDRTSLEAGELFRPIEFGVAYCMRTSEQTAAAIAFGLLVRAGLIYNPCRQLELCAAFMMASMEELSCATELN